MPSTPFLNQDGAGRYIVAMLKSFLSGLGLLLAALRLCGAGAEREELEI